MYYLLRVLDKENEYIHEITIEIPTEIGAIISIDDLLIKNERRIMNTPLAMNRPPASKWVFLQTSWLFNVQETRIPITEFGFTFLMINPVIRTIKPMMRILEFRLFIALLMMN
ncbi:MAG TPA: hypothetical protein VIT44_13725 [Cyclobacteriaceae bacterium]